MSALKQFVNLFTKITTGTLLICAAAMEISGVEEWNANVLWYIAAVGLVTTLITMIILPDKEYSRREGIIRYAVHFVLLSAAVLTMGALFDWYTPSVPGCAVMVLYVAIVYGFTYWTNYLSSKKTVGEINKALDRRRNSK